MKPNYLIIILPLLLARAGMGADLGFRFDPLTHRCVNANGVEGQNPDFLGECGEVVGKNLAGKQLNRINLRGAKLTQVCLVGAQLIAAQLDGAVFQEVDLSKANLSGASLVRADLSNSTMRKANFSGAILSHALFLNLDGTGADFSGAKLDGIDTAQEMVLRFANFTGADMSGFIVCTSQLDMSFSELQGANLSTVEGLPEAKLVGARFDGVTKLPFALEKAKELGMIQIEAVPLTALAK